MLALIHLAGLPDDQITQETLRLTPFRGLTDRAIFTKLLPPGHRSALFISASPLNRDFRTAGHEIHFFYLNTDADSTIVRVEIPTWVAQDPELLNRVHAGILKDCQTTGGFPYTLVRAHELAVIPAQERAAFEDMLQRTLLGHGLRPTQSQKALTKQLTGQRKQHRL